MVNIRKNTAAQWAAENPTLRSGELGVEKDTKKYKIGDGVTTWVNLPYQFDKIMADAIYAPITGSAIYLILDDESKAPQSNLPEHLTVEALSATYVTFVDSVTGLPLVGKHVIITVDQTTDDIADITVEEI